WLSRLSVRCSPVGRLRLWCSSGSLRISPLHPEFRLPLLPSSPTVSNGLSPLSEEISHQTFRAACPRFTPSNSGSRLRPTFYRGCWHVVSRHLFLAYCPSHQPEKPF